MEQTTKTIARATSTRMTRFLKDGAYPHITRDEYYRLRAAADGIVLRLLLELLWTTGGRISEILALRRRDLRRRQERYLLDMPRLKRRKKLRDSLPLPVDLGLKLEDFVRLREIGDDRLLFSLSRTTAWRKIRLLGETVLDCRVTPHMYRHGRIYDLVQRGAHPFVIAKLVGHTDLQTTMGYFHPTEDDLMEAIET